MPAAMPTMMGFSTRLFATDRATLALPSPDPTPSWRSARTISAATIVIMIGSCTAMISAIGTDPSAPKAASASGMPISVVLP